MRAFASPRSLKLQISDNNQICLRCLSCDGVRGGAARGASCVQMLDAAWTSQMRPARDKQVWGRWFVITGTQIFFLFLFNTILFYLRFFLNSKTYQNHRFNAHLKIFGASPSQSIVTHSLQLSAAGTRRSFWLQEKDFTYDINKEKKLIMDHFIYCFVCASQHFIRFSNP